MWTAPYYNTWVFRGVMWDTCPACSISPFTNWIRIMVDYEINIKYHQQNMGGHLSIPESPFPPHASSRPRWGWRGLCWSCWRWWGRARAPLGSKSLATDRRHRSPGVKLRQATYWQCKSVSINEALDNDFDYDRTSFSFWPIFLGPPNTCETWLYIKLFFSPDVEVFFQGCVWILCKDLKLSERIDGSFWRRFIFNARSPPHSWSAIARLLK